MSLRLPRPSKRLLIVIVLLITFYLVLRPLQWPVSPRMIIISLFKPVLSGASKVSTAMGRFADDIGRYAQLAEENRRLKERIAALESSLVRMRDTAIANEEKFMSIRTFLSAHEDLNIDGVAARIIGRDSSNWRASILVDKGPAEGVGPLQAVVWADAVVGVVVESWNGPFGGVSRVKLLSDPECKVWVRSVRSRSQGILQGAGGGMCVLGDRVQPNADFRVGDIIVTTGQAGIFPPSMLVGKVVKRAAKAKRVQLLVTPRIQPDQLEHVLIVQRISSKKR